MGVGRRRAVGIAHWCAGWATLCLVVALWWWASAGNPSPSLASPADTFRAGLDIVTGDVLTEDVLGSITRMLAGFCIGSAIGVVVGLALGMSERLEAWTSPVLEFARAIPPPAILPVAIVVVGVGDTMRVGVVAFGCVWPVLINTANGARSVDQTYVDVARIARWGKAKTLIRVYFPASLPQIFAGLRISVAVALIMMVISEMEGSASGIGHYILFTQRTFRIPETYAGVVIIGIIGWGFNLVFRELERRVLAWHNDARQ